MLRRRVQCRRNAVAHALHVSGDDVEAVAQMSADVLTEDEPGAGLGGDAGDVGPQVAGVIDAEALAGVAEGLTRVACSEDIHCSTPRAAVEGGNVSPDRRRIQGSVFHTRSQYRGCIGFPFDVTDDASSGPEGELDSELEASNPGT